MNADFFFKFAKFKFGSLVNAEDFSDKVNYQWTGALLIIFTAVIAMRQYIFTPIQCWVPPEWPRPWEEYTENYCWIQSTYHVSFKSPDFPHPQKRKELELNYYQWVPFVLALQALLVYIPHVVWKITAQFSGFNPNAMVKFAMEAANIDQDKKKKLVGYLSKQMEKAMRNRTEWRDPNSTYMQFRDCCQNILPCFWFGKRSGTMLVSIYITNKIVYICVGVAHLFLMQYFLGMTSFAFGFNIMRDLINKKQWEETSVFPRVTFCDVPHKTVGQWNIRSVQCVLPVNLLNEKIYVFLWFWVIMCIALSVITAMSWIIKLFLVKNRQNFVSKYLKILSKFAQDSKYGENPEVAKEFVNEFLRHDGVFILMMIKENVGDVVVADIIEDMFTNYCTYLKGNQQQDTTPLLSNHTSSKKMSKASKLNSQLPMPSAPPSNLDLIGPKTIV